MDGANNAGIEPAGKWRRVGSTSEPDTHLADPFAPGGDPWEPGGREFHFPAKEQLRALQKGRIPMPHKPGRCEQEEERRPGIEKGG